MSPTQVCAEGSEPKHFMSFKFAFVPGATSGSQWQPGCLGAAISPGTHDSITVTTWVVPLLLCVDVLRQGLLWQQSDNFEVFVVFGPAGALPMQLAWDWPAAAKRPSTAGDSSDSASGTSGPEAAPAAPADAELLPAHGEDLDSSMSDSASAPDTGSSKRPSSTSSTKAGIQAGKAAAGVGKKGVVPAGPVTTKGSKPNQQTANQQAQKTPVASVGTALAAARVSAHKEAVSVAEVPAEEQQQEHKPAEAPAAEAAPAAADTGVDGAGSEEASTAAAAESVRDNELTVVSCEALLPPGGPSSLLQALHQTSPSTGQPAAGVAAGTDVVSSAAAEQHGVSATSLFSITPQMCMIPAGGQQQLTVSFCSSEARAVQQLVLQGRQSFCQPAGAEGHQECDLKLHLLPSQLATSSSGSQQQDHIAAVQPVKCCITGAHGALVERIPPASISNATMCALAQASAEQLHSVFLTVTPCQFAYDDACETALLLPSNGVSACRRLPPLCRATTQADASPYSRPVCCGSDTSADTI